MGGGESMKSPKRERTRNEILTTAKRIVIERGPEVLTVRLLAESTGFSHTSLYYYYPDFQAFLWAVRLDMIEDMIQALHPVTNPEGGMSTGVEPPADPAGELLDGLLRYGTYFLNNPNVFRFLYFHAAKPPADVPITHELDNRFQGIWQQSFARLVQEGRLSPENLAIVATTLIYTLQGMLLLRLSSYGTQQKDDLRTELTKVLHYLLRNV